MNDETFLSPAAPLNTALIQDAIEAGPVRAHDGSGEDSDALRKRQLRKELLVRLEELLVEFDVIIYAQLAALYYMDVSFFRLCLRSMIQLFYLTPKPDVLPDAPPMHKRPFVGAILGTNVICMFFHLYYDPPQASETTRGYLQGGIIIDFIGQQASNSIAHFVILDIVVLALQMAMLTIVAKIEKLKRRTTPRPPITDTSGPVQGSQDHDSEERGVLRRSSSASAENETSNIESEQQGELDALLGHGTSTTTLSENEINELRSGQAVILDMHVLRTIREQYNLYNDRSGQSTAAEQVQGMADRIALGRRLMMLRAGRRR